MQPKRCGGASSDPEEGNWVSSPTPAGRFGVNDHTTQEVIPAHCGGDLQRVGQGRNIRRELGTPAFFCSLASAHEQAVDVVLGHATIAAAVLKQEPGKG